MPLVNRDFSLTRSALKWITQHYPKCIKFFPNDSTIEAIEIHLRINTPSPYTTLIMSYGILFVLALMEYFIEIEDYERCNRLLGCINLMNEWNPNYKLPIRLDDKWCIENINKSASEILEDVINTRTNKSHPPKSRR